MDKVVISVSGGVAEVVFCPSHIEVDIIDFDNLNVQEAKEAEQVIKQYTNG